MNKRLIKKKIKLLLNNNLNIVNTVTDIKYNWVYNEDGIIYDSLSTYRYIFNNNEITKFICDIIGELYFECNEKELFEEDLELHLIYRYGIVEYCFSWNSVNEDKYLIISKNK